MNARRACSTRVIPQSSKNGMDITQPFYWNIAPNYDATITSRFMDRRGLMEQVEFRYMPDPAHVGSLYFENLANDKQYDETPSLNNYLSDGHRYLLNARHTSMFMDNAMRVSVDYTKVRDRDYNYFNDFSPKVGTQVDNQLQQSLMAGYFQPNWNINTEVRTYQILLASAQQPHELMPRIDHNYYQQGILKEDLAWNTEITKFGYNNAQAIAQNQGSAYTGTRVYTAPTLTMPLIDEAGYYLDSQYKLMYTRYRNPGSAGQHEPDLCQPLYSSRRQRSHPGRRDHHPHPALFGLKGGMSLRAQPELVRRRCQPDPGAGVPVPLCALQGSGQHRRL